jgi:hypothetical protein
MDNDNDSDEHYPEVIRFHEKCNSDPEWKKSIEKTKRHIKYKQIIKKLKTLGPKQQNN